MRSHENLKTLLESTCVLCEQLSIAPRGIFAKEYYPFGKRAHNKYQIPSSKNKKRALNAKEVDAIKELSTEPGSRAERAKYFWLFSYYLNGCNVTDIAYLQWKNIDFKEGVVQFIRKKTERANSSNLVMVTGVINQHVKDTIQKFGSNDNKPGIFVFEIINTSDSTESQFKKIKESFVDLMLA